MSTEHTKRIIRPPQSDVAIHQESDHVAGAIESIESSKEMIAGLASQMNEYFSEILAEVNDTIRNCEAEIKKREKMNVVFKPNGEVVFSFERVTRFAKSR